MDQAMWISKRHILPAQQQGNISFFSFAREEFTVLMLETLTDK
jgi:hypothetical protein